MPKVNHNRDAVFEVEKLMINLCETIINGHVEDDSPVVHNMRYNPNARVRLKCDLFALNEPVYPHSWDLSMDKDLLLLEQGPALNDYNRSKTQVSIEIPLSDCVPCHVRR